MEYRAPRYFLDRMTIDRHRASAEAFLEDAASQALAVSLDKVTMSEIDAADRAWDEGDGELALARLRLAFDRVIKDSENRKVWVRGVSLFELRPGRGHIADTARTAASANSVLRTTERPDRTYLITHARPGRLSSVPIRNPTSPRPLRTAGKPGARGVPMIGSG